MKYEINKKILNSSLEDLIIILEKIQNDISKDELTIEDSINLFEFGKKIENLIFNKLEKIKYKFNEIIISKNNEYEIIENDEPKKNS